MNTKTIIKELREAEGISQKKLAEITGLTQSSIARWELNLSEPTSTAIAILANYFNVTTDELLGIENSFKPIQNIYPKIKTINNVNIKIIETKEKTIIEIEK